MTDTPTRITLSDGSVWEYRTFPLSTMTQGTRQRWVRLDEHGFERVGPFDLPIMAKKALVASDHRKIADAMEPESEPLCSEYAHHYDALIGDGRCRCGQTTRVSAHPDTAPLNALAAAIHSQNRKWWYGPDGARLHRNKAELLMLVVTEIAEAMEGERKNLMDDKLPHRRMAEVEVVDAVIRLLDYAAGFGYDLDGALREKLAYNAQREDHKREAALIARDAQFAAARAGESRNG